MQMFTPKVSVIVPTFNSAKYISRCIESILNQTESHLEIIIIDDGSTDNTCDICKQYQVIDDRVKYYYTKNNGVSAARNKGLNIASGKYILFVDSDDCLIKSCLKTCTDIMESTDFDIIKFGYVSENEDGNCSLISIDESRKFSDNINTLLEYVDSNKYYSFVWNMFIRRDTIGELRFDEDINWLEDQIFSYQCYLKSKKILLIPDVLYHYYRWNAGSLSNVKDPLVIAKASIKEYNLKLQLTDLSTYRRMVVQEYKWRLDFLVKALYADNYSCSFRHRFAKQICFDKPLLTRESRLFFSKRIPFVVRNSILSMLFKTYKLIGRNTELNRI